MTPFPKLSESLAPMAPDDEAPHKRGLLDLARMGALTVASVTAARTVSRMRASDSPFAPHLGMDAPAPGPKPGQRSEQADVEDAQPAAQVGTPQPPHTPGELARRTAKLGLKAGVAFVKWRTGISNPVTAFGPLAEETASLAQAYVATGVHAVKSKAAQLGLIEPGRQPTGDIYTPETSEVGPAHGLADFASRLTPALKRLAQPLPKNRMALG